MVEKKIPKKNYKVMVKEEKWIVYWSWVCYLVTAATVELAEGA